MSSSEGSIEATQKACSKLQLPFVLYSLVSKLSSRLHSLFTLKPFVCILTEGVWLNTYLDLK